MRPLGTLLRRKTYVNSEVKTAPPMVGGAVFVSWQFLQTRRYEKLVYKNFMKGDHSMVVTQINVEQGLIYPVCKHRWMIAPPNGPTSSGSCRLCGEKRDFVNYTEKTTWGYNVSLEDLRRRERIGTTTDQIRKDALTAN